jgi:hypothetical protein
VDASFAGMLIASGATASQALAADLVWRATTYLPPIFLGIVTYVLWRRGTPLRSTREAAGADPRSPAAEHPQGAATADGGGSGVQVER